MRADFKVTIGRGESQFAARFLWMASALGRDGFAAGAPFAFVGLPDAMFMEPFMSLLVARDVVASLADASTFGKHLAASAWSLGFSSAILKCFIADGSSTGVTGLPQLQKHRFSGTFDDGVLVKEPSGTFETWKLGVRGVRYQRLTYRRSRFSRRLRPIQASC